LALSGNTGHRQATDDIALTENQWFTFMLPAALGFINVDRLDSRARQGLRQGLTSEDFSHRM
jgi:hypothetical protein